MRFLLIVLILFSFLGLAAHHHDADHDTHDCPACQAAQTILFLMSAFTAFIWIDTVRFIRPFFDRTPALFSAFHGATLSNRAPPLFA